jgi:hypothetical protein
MPIIKDWTFSFIIVFTPDFYLMITSTALIVDQQIVIISEKWTGCDVQGNGHGLI